MESGGLDVLNVGAGDLNFSFNRESPEERERAQKMIEDMLHQGYAIMVRNEDGTYSRVERFDPERDAYVIGERTAPTPDQPKKRSQWRRAPRATTSAVAIGRSAGG